MLLPLLVVGGAVGAYIYFFRPPWARRLGRRLKIVAYAYVAAILISAVLRLWLGWGVSAP